LATPGATEFGAPTKPQSVASGFFWFMLSPEPKANKVSLPGPSVCSMRT